MSADAPDSQDIDDWLSTITESPDFGAISTKERLQISAAVLIVEHGFARTEMVAKRARISESTMFRYVDGRDALVEESIEWAWQQINEAIATANFETPVLASHIETIVNDFDAVLRMYDAPLGRLAVTLALAQMRRPNAFKGVETRGHAQTRFFSRLESLCSHVVGEADARRVAIHTANLIAAAWFPWLVDGDKLVRSENYLLGRERMCAGLKTDLERLTADVAKQDGAGTTGNRPGVAS